MSSSALFHAPRESLTRLTMGMEGNYAGYQQYEYLRPSKGAFGRVRPHQMGQHFTQFGKIDSAPPNWLCLRSHFAVDGIVGHVGWEATNRSTVPPVSAADGEPQCPDDSERCAGQFAGQRQQFAPHLRSSCRSSNPTGYVEYTGWW